MNIGLSIPITFLSGESSTDEDTILSDAFGNNRDMLLLLKDHAVNSIEIRKLNNHISAEAFNKALSVIHQAGMKFTIHGYLPEKINPEDTIDKIYPWIKQSEFTQETIFTVHAHKSLDNTISESDLALSTAKTLTKLKQALLKGKIPAKIALELNRYHGYNEPNTSFTGTNEILNLTDENCQTGICWDLGHSYWNTLNADLSGTCPVEFLEKVVHTHIHDLGEDGGTHYSLSMNKISFSMMMIQLINSGYTGVYNLELNFIYHPRNVKEEILFSINKLKNILSEI